jgi:chemotaxis response regulator CheB
VGNVVGLVLADHHRVFVEGLTMLLDAEPTLIVLGVAYDGRRAVELAAEHRPVVLLLDAYMSSNDPAGTVTAVKSASPATKVLLLAPEARRIIVAAPARAERWSWTLLALPLAACLVRSSRTDTALGAYAVFLSFLPVRNVQPNPDAYFCVGIRLSPGGLEYRALRSKPCRR